MPSVRIGSGVSSALSPESKNIPPDGLSGTQGVTVDRQSPNLVGANIERGKQLSSSSSVGVALTALQDSQIGPTRPQGVTLTLEVATSDSLDLPLNLPASKVSPSSPPAPDSGPTPPSKAKTTSVDPQKGEAPQGTPRTSVHDHLATLRFSGATQEVLRNQLIDLFALGSGSHDETLRAALHVLDPVTHVGTSQEGMLKAASFRTIERAAAVLPTAAHDASFSPPLLASRFRMIHAAMLHFSSALTPSQEIWGSRSGRGEALLRLAPGAESLFTEARWPLLFDLFQLRRQQTSRSPAVHGVSNRVELEHVALLSPRAMANHASNRFSHPTPGVIDFIKAGFFGLIGVFRTSESSESSSKGFFIQPWAMPGAVFDALKSHQERWETKVRARGGQTPSILEYLEDFLTSKQTERESWNVILYLFFFLLLIFTIPFFLF